MARVRPDAAAPMGVLAIRPPAAHVGARALLLAVAVSVPEFAAAALHTVVVAAVGGEPIGALPEAPAVRPILDRAGNRETTAYIAAVG